MILPPLYGASIKNDDNAWEKLRLSHFGLDTMKYNKPNKLIKISTLHFDILKCLNSTDARIFHTMLNMDLVKHQKPEYYVQCTTIPVDIIKYQTYSEFINISHTSIDLLKTRY